VIRFPSLIAACAFGVLALAGCNKHDAQNAARNETVTITQATPPPGGDWSEVVNATSAGFMMGNPDAKVKLIEIGALTCPHCREFDEKGVPSLIENYVKSGKVSWEFRTYLLQGPDIPAALIARCNGTKGFFPLARALYADQAQWMGKLIATPQAQLEQVQNLPEKKEFIEMARLAGLQDWAAARGVPQAKSNQCLTDTRKIDQLVQLSSDVNAQYPDFVGTPSFIINGVLLKETASWDKLEPQLKAALQ
jgi:protein-disulfide isomerase